MFYFPLPGRRFAILFFVTPSVSTPSSTDHLLDAFIVALSQRAFSGDIDRSLSARLVGSVDNSVYQVLPQAIFFPKSHADVEVFMSVLQDPRFDTFSVTGRGACTAPNGQSLSPGLILDFSRYLNRVIAIDRQEQEICVEPGICLDAINAALKPHGYFFPASVAPGNRVTIGGMVNTDACGKGSAFYGRTSDYIAGIKGVLADGSPFDTASLVDDHPLAGIQHQVTGLLTDHQAEIQRVFPAMSRFMTGYNLSRSLDVGGILNLNKLLAGSEGTLALMTEIRLRILPLPAYKRLVVLAYADFETALADAWPVLTLKPTAVESIDEHLMALVHNEAGFALLQDRLSLQPSRDGGLALTLLEFDGDDEARVQGMAEQAVSAYWDRFGSDGVGAAVFRKTADIASIWKIRKEAVGLVARLPGNRKPVAFVEDTAVDPGKLLLYIQDFKALLANYGLAYGMYGHLDVGCIHVRPALDLTQDTDRLIMKNLTDDVAKLVKRYRGVMWAEHGRGFRQPYTKAFFGETLFNLLIEIKALFDPGHRLNPGKIVPAPGPRQMTVQVDAQLRGHRDQAIFPVLKQHYDGAVNCNGNGACLDWHPKTLMCPSLKVSQNKLASPKGRATMLREWLRLRSTSKSDAKSFAPLVYESLHSCLSCKGCTSHCPLHVDIPEYKSRFLAAYYERRRRPLRDRLFAAAEELLVFGDKPLGQLLGPILAWPWVATLVKTYLRIVDMPASAGRTACRQLVRHFPEQGWQDIVRGATDKTVVLWQDAFNRFVDPQVIYDGLQVLRHCGFHVHRLTYRSSGKSRHLFGYRKTFQEMAHDNVALLRALKADGIPVICFEPSISYVFRDEYRHVTDLSPKETLVQPVSDWLAAACQSHQPLPMGSSTPRIPLFLHCHEQSLDTAAGLKWQTIGAVLGVRFDLQDVGCCGMAGVFGHCSEHSKMSKEVYALSWRDMVAAAGDTPLAVTGFSCRHQVGRCSQKTSRHPLQVLLDLGQLTPLGAPPQVVR